MEEQLVKYFSGNLPPDGVREIEAWRSASDENAAEFLACHQAWKFSEDREVDSAGALAAVMNRIDAIEGKGETIKTNGFGAYLKYAAIAILGIGLVFFGQSLFTDTPEQLAIKASENIEIIALPDGSVVTLSSHSVLTYDAEFTGKSRNVSLKGKAFFDIQRDESKPFIVTTDQSKIEVLGTSFLVNTTSANAVTEVVVKSGRVAVSKKEVKNAETVELVAGEVGRLDANAASFSKSTIDDYNYLAWKTKLIEFNNHDLKTVFDVLRDVYGVEIFVSDEAIYKCQMSAKFDNQPMSAVLEILSRTFSLELSQSGDKTFYLSGEGCVVE